MVKFKQTMGGYEVHVDDKHFGWLSKEHGFFTDSTVIKSFMVISMMDLVTIARHAESIKKTGYLL